MHDVDAAIAVMTEAEIPACEKAYGFSVMHTDLVKSSRNFAECGCEHDGSISMSVYVDEMPPVVWFFRFDFREMACLITESYRRLSSNASRAEIISQMRLVDAEYNHDELDARINEWQKEFERRFSNGTR
ncbi:hypothetical protein C1752_10968 [Acaryochloris thomasi RCC1774]|uniref:Uncharacterized protein n=2 Tax=Acaryochloris TaxID=155977 RepID=A0A2W1J7X7_9CYAN|nr:hypothetical protein C1752_10968 [Acaryochloris thomasi RCC1774]